MADGMMRCLSTTHSATLMERLTIRPGCKKTAAKSLAIPQARRSRGERISSGIPALLAVLSVVTATAEELPDPTRPPAALAAPATSAGKSAGATRPTGLQSTIISRSRRAAIIDGKTVELWAKHGNAQLVEVNEGSVVLQGAQTRQVLTLFPDVKIRQRPAKSGEAFPESNAQRGAPKEEK